MVTALGGGGGGARAACTRSSSTPLAHAQKALPHVQHFRIAVAISDSSLMPTDEPHGFSYIARPRNSAFIRAGRVFLRQRGNP